ncbi:MAG: toprim domain-containing protein [Bacteroidetes bacterium]|nr:toprim domain-containing protein [Bacteroidota bacterium]
MSTETKKKILSCSQINQIDIVSYLSTLGISPSKIKGNNYWFFSPFRNEKTPSFKVNRRLNRWYDFGEGKGTTLVDFGIRYFDCSIKDLIQQFSGFAHLEIVPQKNILIEEVDESFIVIKKISTLNSGALFQYLHQRRIPLNVAQKHCCEVEFEFAEKNFFAIGFKNKQGGYELSNKYFKGSSSPKDITLIKHPASDDLAVFEGFFDFLSWQVLFPDNSLESDFLILNSLSFFEKSIPLMDQYKTVRLLIDNDEPGNRIISHALKRSHSYIDGRKLYRQYKDVNDFLCGIK